MEVESVIVGGSLEVESWPKPEDGCSSESASEMNCF